MVFRMVSGIILSRVTPQVIHQLRVRIFCAMQNLSLAFFTNKQTGSLMGRVDNDSFDVYGFIVDVAPQFLSNVVKVIGLVVLMLSINPILSACMFGVVLVVIGIEFVWFRGQKRMWRGRDIARRGVNAVLSDAVGGHRVVKAFALRGTGDHPFRRQKRRAVTMPNTTVTAAVHTFSRFKRVYTAFLPGLSIALACISC